MSRKMKVETEILRLRRLNESYKSLADKYAHERDDAEIRYQKYTTLTAQTADALDALEGRPSLKQQLEEALRPRPIVDPNAPEPQPNGSIVIPSPNNLPPAEDGFHWAWNNGEWVLVANELWINSQNAQEANTAIPLTLPAVMDDEEFTDKPQDFLG